MKKRRFEKGDTVKNILTNKKCVVLSTENAILSSRAVVVLNLFEEHIYLEFKKNLVPSRILLIEKRQLE